MSRINTNVNSLIAQRILTQNNLDLTRSLERLSTGFRINRGGDDPAGLIVSEQLRSEIRTIEAAIGNAQRADQVVNIMEGGLQEISSLLLEVQSLVGQNGSDGGLSTEEREANQLQVDQIIQTIDRIAAATSFNGTKLLNGSQDFTVSSVDGNVDDFTVFGAKFEPGSSIDVSITVTQSAQHGSLFLNLGDTRVDTGGDDADERFTFELAGPQGTREFSFGSGTAIAAVTTAINQFKEATGVSAVTSGDYVELKSTSLGSSQFVSVEVRSATAGQVGSLDEHTTTDENLAGGTSTDFTDMTEAIRDAGQDVGAVVNGQTASGNGGTVSVGSDALDLSITLDTAAGGAQTIGSVAALSITGGGAKFNIGPGVNITNQVRLGVRNIASRRLGNNTIGFLDDLGSGKSTNLLDGNLDTAQKIVDEAVSQVSSLRSRLGAFQNNVVQSTIRAMSIALENSMGAESMIRDTDFAAETAALTRSQILVQAAGGALGIANSQPQAVLGLL